MNLSDAAPEFLANLGALSDFANPIRMPSGRRARPERFMKDRTVLMRYEDGERELVTVTDRFLQHIVLMEAL
ncbi:hypothetical protein CCO03_08635 [Comamonas serinivorans]|uniref:Uncharacterized protein n=1 Tax=Comamonas serinivorans TaxID=1082851 RepID=A0A1Y0EM66_9BURK|nr:hypothetical protein [Comamonas serinivorans]ARU04733.1 hypothetical protein CCO03_08635 [Comamonas serinivorans]